MPAGTSLEASQSLLKGIRTALLADSALQLIVAGQVFAAPPSNTKAPFITMNIAVARDFSTATEDGQEFTIDLHAWDQPPGQVPDIANTYKMIERLRSVLHFATLNLASPFRCVMIQCVNIVGPYIEQDGSTIHGVATFRVLVDHT